MKSRIATEHPHTRRIFPVASATAIAATLAFSLSQPALADRIVVPDVPPDLKIDAPNLPFLLGRGVGTQNYVCAPSSSSSTGVAYVLFTPQATLFNDDFKEITTHFFSPNPFEVNASSTLVADGPIRATWQALDTSSVWAQVKKKEEASSDPTFVKQGAVQWLKLTVVGAEAGPTGGDKLAHTTFIHRVNTTGGLAPTTGCATGSDLGNQAFMPYTADYIFYTDQ